MSDQIDVNVVAIGGESVDGVTSAIDALAAAMERLGNSSALSRLAEQVGLLQGAMTTSLGTLTQQVKDMQQVIATGFADLSATSTKMLEAMGNGQVRTIKDNGDKAAAALTENNAKISAAMRADANTLLQASRGVASNVEQAFALMFVGVSPETVRDQFGRIAVEAAQGIKSVEELMQFRANAKSIKATGYDPMAGATEAEMQQAVAMNAQIDAAAAAAHQALVERRDLDEYRARSAASAELQALIEKRDLDEYRIRSAASAELKALIEKRDVEEYQLRSAAAQRIVEIEQRRDLELYSMRSAEASRMADIQQRRDMEEYTAAQTQAQRIIEIEQRRDVELHRMRTAAAADGATQAERQRTLNTNYLTASPATQVRTAMQAQTYASLGGDAEAKYGSAAAGADALAAAEARLAASARGSAAAQLEMNDVLRQAEGAFRGAAHEAGIYGLHHGQLIALLAGGAVAAGLHHIAETGAEVEFQLKSLNALSGDMTPINVDKFVGITAGTMTGLKDAAEGVHALAQAGLSQQEAFRSLPDVMRLAQLGEMSVAQAAEMAVESMHAFGLTSADIGRVGDTLVAVGSQANVSVHTLAEDMKSAAVTGQLFNLSMEEITATVGSLAERGLTIQPLSSALNKLYEPSAKTAKAMREMGLSVRDASGQFKNYSDFMHELSDKVNEFKEAGDPLKALGMSPQSIKAMEVMTQHIENYDHLLHTAKDSANKMFEATAAKADTVEGAWLQLGSTLQGSMVKAFQDAGPVIRQIENDLLGIAGSSEVKDFFSGLATGVANVTRAMIENRGTIEAALVGYAALRVVPPILEGISAATVFLFGRTTAATAAIAAEGTAATLATGQLELFAAGETAAAAGAAEVAATAATAEVVLGGFAVAARTALSVLGPLGLALAAVSVGYEMFRGASTKAEQDHTRMGNSIDSTITSMEQELEHLKSLQEQLEKTGKIGAESAYRVQLAFAQMEESKARADLDAASAAAKGPRKLEAGDDGTLTQFESNEAGSGLAAARAAFDRAHERATKLEQLHDSIAKGRETVQIGSDITKLEEKIKSLPHELEGLAAANPKKADALRQQVEDIGKLVVTKSNYNDALKQEKDLEAAINSGKRNAPATLAGDKDGARARIEQLQEELRLAQMLSKSRLDDAKSENKRGELGDLQLINKTLAENVALHETAVDIAKRERTAAGPLKPGQQEKFNSRVKSAEQQVKDDYATAARAIADAIDKMDTQELQARAKVLESKGQLEDAYNLTWQAKNASLMSNLASDIEDAENTQYRGRLERFQRFMEDQRRLGANDARFKEGEHAFSSSSAELDRRLSARRLQSGPGTGLANQIGNLGGEQDDYAAMLPKLQAAYTKVSAASSVVKGGGSDQQLKAAENELRTIQDRMAAMRNIGVDMGQAIAKSLSDAFGQGGAALGGMIQSAAAYDAKMKEIQATLQSDGSAEAQKSAAEATASAQIKAYGDMSGAAKGFFDVGSNGYKIMAKTEQAFRAIELADAAAVMVKKIFFKQGEVAANLALNGVKASGETAATAVSVANAGTEASAWGVTAVAKALASLPPPLNFAAAAATMAAVVALGIKMTGGFNGGGQTQAQKEQQNATGTVLGDRDAKSESNAKSLDLVQKNTYNNLVVAQGMLTALRSIDSNIKGFVSQLFQAGAVDGSAFSTSNSGLYGALRSGTSAGAGSLLGAGVGYAAGAGLSAFTALASIGGPIGMVIGGIAGKYLGSAMASILGGKQSISASGFTVSASTLGQISSGGANALSYADITTSGGWFHGDSHSTQTAALGDAANLQVTKVISGMGDAISSAAGLLGENGADFKDKLNGFVVDIGKIDLKGLSSADAQSKVAAAFSKLGDQMAQAAFGGLEQFQQAGEGYLETLTRVATDYATVDTIFKSFGTTYAQVGTASIAAREELVSMAGGLDKFTSQAEWFFQNMLTKGQQTAATSAAIQPTLDKYGLSTQGADAVQKFTDLTIAMGAMGGAGAQAYTDLMNIAQAFKSVTDVASDLQKQIDDLTMSQVEKDAVARATLDPSNQNLYDQLVKAKAVAQAKSDLLTAYQNESSAIQSTIDRLKSLSQSLRSFVNGLQIGNMSPLNPADQYGAARAQFEDTLQKAQAGDITSQGNLQTAAQAFLQASKTANASNSTYQSDYQRVVSTMTGMANQADSQVKTAQTSLALLNQQVSQLVKIDSSVTSVASAINNLAVILANGKDAGVNTVALTQLYKELLGRDPDQAGLDYWNKQLQSGVSLSDIIAAMKNSSEYVDHTGTTSPTTVVTPSTNGGTAMGTTNPAGLAAAVEGLYKDLLGRVVDGTDAGVQYWVKQLQGGVTISAVTAAIQTSNEYLDHIKAATTATASTTPAKTTVTTPAATTVTAPASTGAAASSGSSSAIASLYQSLLGHAPDSAGLAYWVGQMQNGVSISAISAAIKTSSEYQAHASTSTMSSSSAKQAAPATTVQADPYASATAQNAQVVAQLAALNKQVTTLITDQQTQADQQVSATMTAAANTADNVAEAVTIAAQKSSWAAQTAVALR